MTNFTMTPWLIILIIYSVVGVPFPYISHCKYNLYKLDCKESGLRKVPSCVQLEKNIIFLCHKILQIDISSNLISALEMHTMDAYRSVKHLNLENNSVYYVHQNAIQNLDNLEVLQLSHNPVATTILSSTSLLHLEMSDCLIESLNLQLLPSLQSIDVSRNHLISLRRETFLFNHNLRSVILSHNNIETIEPGTFWSLKNLTYLDLSFNKIKSIAQNLLQVEDRWLRLDLSHNFLETIDLEASVNSLNLSNNRIRFLEPDLSRRLLSLEVLDLSGNFIQSVPNIISGSLSQLFLRNNSIMYLGSDALVALPNLTYIDLASNNFKHPFEPYLFRNNPFLLQVWLGNNPWACKCWSSSSFHHLFQFLTKPPRKLADPDEVECFTPKKWRGMQWDQACSRRWNNDKLDLGQTDLIAIFLITTIVALSSGCLVCLLLIRFFPASQRDNGSNPRLTSGGTTETTGTELQELQKPPSFEEALSMPLLKDEAQLRRPLTSSEKEFDEFIDVNEISPVDDSEPPSYQEAVKENTSQL